MSAGSQPFTFSNGALAGPIQAALYIELGCSSIIPSQSPVTLPALTLSSGTNGSSIGGTPVVFDCAQSIEGVPALAGHGLNLTDEYTYNANLGTAKLPPQFSALSLLGPQFVAGSAINNGPQPNPSACTVYGDKPAAVINSVDGLQQSASICTSLQGTLTSHGQVSLLTGYTDRGGIQRSACLFHNSASTPGHELPLITWLHPSLVGSDVAFLGTGWQQAAITEPLNNQDPSLIGFNFLLVEGRDTAHQYPFPDGTGVGWDNWYRNYDRCSPFLNVDVATIDYYLNVTVTQTPVDEQRLFMSGWSNGAAMAIQYSLLTPGIASAAVYSAPDAWRDAVNVEHCQQTPPVAYDTPIFDLHNYCDIIGICTTGSYFNYDLLKRYPYMQATFESIAPDESVVGVTNRTQATAACDPTCSTSSGLTPGSTYHTRWPTLRNEDFFTFMRDHPLSYPRQSRFSPQSTVSRAILYGPSP